jgi:diguanylate cyclase (GGDEF)-like protein
MDTPEPSLEDTAIFTTTITIAPKVLLVDDDEIVIEYLKPMVEAAGFEVLTATSGEAALKGLAENFAPIVILDRNMPGMDGLEVTRAIRANIFPGYVYVMLLTVQDGEEDILAGLGAGADDYLSKRASSAQLIARLRTAQRILSLEHSLKNMVEERRRLAMTDALTGAHNRRYFLRHGGREVRRVQRFGGALSLLALDIDFFKSINDRFGHASGDLVLIEVVKRISQGLPRASDWCARLGGEEFAVVLPETDLAGAALVAERLRGSIAAKPVQLKTGNKVPVSVSIGVGGLQALGNPKAASIESLLAMADDCLYRSKADGRNRVTVAKSAAPLPKPAHG